MYNKKVWNTGERITADKLNNIEEGVYSNALVNKTQQVYINGLFNENKDGRLSVEGEGNDLKLEGSKEGLVEVDKVVGNTINARYLKIDTPTIQSPQNYNNVSVIDKGDYYECKATALVDSVVSWNYWNGKLNLGLSTGSVYTVVIYDCPKTSQWGKYILRDNNIGENLYYTKDVQKWKITSVSDGLTYGFYSMSKDSLIGEEIIINFPKKILILEGDYTNKPIPSQYFKGLKSSFESNLVTQEMVAQGLESEENLGKYKVPVRLVGKNLFGGSMQLAPGNVNLRFIGFNFKYPGEYTISFNYEGELNNSLYLGNGNYKKQLVVSNNKVKTTISVTDYDIECIKKTGYFHIYRGTGDLVLPTNFQIEEGTVATEHEDYFEHTTNAYLNSPLLEGDTIENVDGKITHVHRYKRDVFDGSDDENWVIENATSTVYIACHDLYRTLPYDNTILVCDKLKTISDKYSEEYGICGYGNLGDYPTQNWIYVKIADYTNTRAWLKDNPITVVYKLATPIYEIISEDKVILECANDSTLHIESIVPVESVKASYTTGIPNAYLLQETNDNQDDLIDISLCATDEMYMMIEPLLSAVPQTMSERMVSKMVEMYVAMVERGLKTIDEVPLRYREQVKEILESKKEI